MCLPTQHDWQQVSIHCKPTTFPGNQPGWVALAISGDVCLKCHAIRSPTKLDDKRWPVKED